MASLTITNTFTTGTTILASEVNTNFTDISTYINNRNAGSTDWDFVSSAGLITAKALFRSNDGTAGAPAWSWTSDTDTGIIRSTTNTMDLVTGGTSRFTLNTTDLTTTLPFLSADGTDAAPTYSFSSDPDTGITRIANNSVSLSTQGTEGFRVNGSQQTLISDGTVTIPGRSYLSDSDTGEFRPGSDVIAWTTGAEEVFRLGAGSSSDDTAVTHQWRAGPSGIATIFREYTTTGVTTSPKTIHTLDQFANLVVVAGDDAGTRIFGDLVFCAFGVGSPTVIASTASGSPDTRTYTVSSGNLQLQMGANTYQISSMSIQQRNR